MKTQAEKALTDVRKSINALSSRIKDLQNELTQKERHINRLEYQRDKVYKELESKHNHLLYAFNISLEKEQTYIDGLEFEKYVVRWMYKHFSRYKLEVWQGDKSEYVDQIISADWNSYPDLIFVDEEEKKVVAIECKYRKDGVLSISKKKLAKYKHFQDQIAKWMQVDIKVYVMIGTSGTASSNPDWMYCLPIDSFDFSVEGEYVVRDMRHESQYKVMERASKKTVIKTNISF